jgi:hypothetical protein
LPKKTPAKLKGTVQLVGAKPLSEKNKDVVVIVISLLTTLKS